MLDLRLEGGIALPEDRSSERLLVPTRTERPRDNHRGDEAADIAAMAAALRHAADAAPDIVVATDDRAVDGCSSWAVVVTGFAMRVKLEDDSAFVAELTALRTFGLALQEACITASTRPLQASQITIVLACLGAIRVVERDLPPRNSYRLVAVIPAALASAAPYFSLGCRATARRRAGNRRAK